jgi:hypothetical protein
VSSAGEISNAGLALWNRLPPFYFLFFIFYFICLGWRRSGLGSCPIKNRRKIPPLGMRIISLGVLSDQGEFEKKGGSTMT